ncbi:hypothetical protein [Mucilaginibacter sp.]
MAAGLDDVLILIELKRDVLIAYFNYMISPRTENVSLTDSKPPLMYIQK